MKMTVFVAALGVCFVSLACVVGCSKKEDGTVLKLAHGLNMDHPVHKAMEFMAEKVAEKSGGKMTVKVYPSEQLGNEKECIEKLQMGALAMTKTSSSPMEAFVDEMKVLGLPYIFRDNDHFWEVMLGPIGKELLAAGESSGLKGLCYYDAGARSFYTVDKRVEKPADLKDLTIRVQQSPVAMALVRAMGASPTPISWGELYTSLQQGVVDGAENNPPSVYTSKHFEICKFYCLDEHTMPPDILLISAKVWNKLTAEEQRILQEAVDESVTYQREVWAKFQQESMDKIKEAGMEIIRPEKEPFREAVKPMFKEYEGTKIGDLVKRIGEG